MTICISLYEDMKSPATRALFAALEAKGGAGCVRFVGGCVRNALMDRPVSDVDLATQLTPDATEAALAEAGIRSVPTGKAFGTITAVVDHEIVRGGDGEGHSIFEITSLREDVETDGRRAVVTYTTDWARDAQRRDFYLNALYADIDGNVFDPTGQGLEDAAHGRVRFIGEPQQRIREDYLRILRFFRFSAGYAEQFDDESLAACIALKAGIDGLSGERIWGELMKIIALAKPERALDAMQAGGLMPHVMPGWTLEADGLPEFAAMVRLSRNKERRFMALVDGGMGLETPVVANLRERLKFPGAIEDRLCKAGLAAAACIDVDAERVARLVYSHGKMAVEDALFLLTAHGGGPLPETLLGHVAATPVPVFPVKGSDLMARGMQPGPGLGVRLKQIESDWVHHDFSQSVIDEALDAVAKAHR